MFVNAKMSFCFVTFNYQAVSRSLFLWVCSWSNYILGRVEMKFIFPYQTLWKAEPIVAFCICNGGKLMVIWDMCI